MKRPLVAPLLLLAACGPAGDTADSGPGAAAVAAQASPSGAALAVPAAASPSAAAANDPLAPAAPLAGHDCLILLLDALHSAHLGCYGGPPDVAPNLDHLAAEGVRCDQARSNCSWTLPSTTTLFSGLFQETHGLHFDVDIEQIKLDEGVDTLAELFHEAGYETAYLNQNPFSGQQYGLSQGFDVYREFNEFRESAGRGRRRGRRAALDAVGQAALHLRALPQAALALRCAARGSRAVRGPGLRRPVRRHRGADLRPQPGQEEAVRGGPAAPRGPLRGQHPPGRQLAAAPAGRGGPRAHAGAGALRPRRSRRAARGPGTQLVLVGGVHPHPDDLPPPGLRHGPRRGGARRHGGPAAHAARAVRAARAAAGRAGAQLRGRAAAASGLGGPSGLHQQPPDARPAGPGRDRRRLEVHPHRAGRARAAVRTCAPTRASRRTWSRAPPGVLEHLRDLLVQWRQAQKRTFVAPSEGLDDATVQRLKQLGYIR